MRQGPGPSPVEGIQENLTLDNIEDLLLKIAEFHKPPMIGLRPIPDSDDDLVRNLVSWIWDAQKEDRQLVLSLMWKEYEAPLHAFAGRMATLTVRSGNAQFARDGLRAVAIASHLYSDWRDFLMELNILYVALERLGLNPEPFFAEIFGFSEASFDRQVRAFPGASAKVRSDEAYRYIGVDDDDGPRFVSPSLMTPIQESHPHLLKLLEEQKIPAFIPRDRDYPEWVIRARKMAKAEKDQTTPEGPTSPG